MDFKLLEAYDYLQDIVYLTDLETLEIKWMNKLGRRVLGDRWKSVKCYEFFHEYTNKCSHCKQCDFLAYFDEYLNGSRVYNHITKVNGKSYKSKKAAVLIEGKKYTLDTIYDVEDILNTSLEHQKNVEIYEQLLSEVAHIKYKQSQDDKINHILEIVKKLFEPVRASIIKEGCPTPIFKIKNEDVDDFKYNSKFCNLFNDSDDFIKQFNENKYIVLESKKLKETHPDLYNSLTDADDYNAIIMMWSVNDENYYMVLENCKEIVDDQRLYDVVFSYLYYAIRSFSYNQMLYKLGNVDNLTNIYNRNKYNNDLSGFYKNSMDRVAVMFLDLDNLKSVNDSFGHSIGDKMLIATTKILKECFIGDNIYRVGGDEFIVISLNTTYEEFMNKVELMNSRFDNGRISRSYGVSYSNDNANVSTLVSSAENEMYVYKRKHHEQYSYELQKEAVCEKLKYEIAKGSFYVVLQPKINPYTLQVVGAEALIRGNNKNYWCYPNEFIPIFEKNNVIDLIDYFMLEESMKIQRKILDSGKNTYPISVNISRSTLLLASFEEDMIKMLKKYNLSSELIHLEITERMDVSSEDILINGQKLRNYGLKLEVDDFGTHFTNLAFLSKDVFSVVKIDRSIFNKIRDDNITRKLIDVVIEECHKRNIIVLAEGVETSDDVELIKSMYIDEVQGYFYDKPLPVDDYIAKYIK